MSNIFPPARRMRSQLMARLPFLFRRQNSSFFLFFSSKWSALQICIRIVRWEVFRLHDIASMLACTVCARDTHVHRNSPDARSLENTTAEIPLVHNRYRFSACTGIETLQCFKSVRLSEIYSNLTWIITVLKTKEMKGRAIVELMKIRGNFR